MAVLPTREFEWTGDYPDCDLCGEEQGARYDVPTVYNGSWGHLCAKCARDFGSGLAGTLGTQLSRVD